MTIERISFPAGILVESVLPNKLDESVGKLKKENGSRAVALAPGEYDLTPSQGTPPPWTYSLLVLENGTGVLRNVARTVSPSTGRRLSFAVGGKTIELTSENEKPVAIAGVKNDGTGPYVFEILSYRK